MSLKAATEGLGLELKVEETWHSETMYCYQRRYYRKGEPLTLAIKRSNQIYKKKKGVVAATTPCPTPPIFKQDSSRVPPIPLPRTFHPPGNCGKTQTHPRGTNEPRGRCIRCASDLHHSDQCFVLSLNLSCEFCRRPGHLAIICCTKASQEKNQVSVITMLDNFNHTYSSDEYAIRGVDPDRHVEHQVVSSIILEERSEVTPCLPIVATHESGSFHFRSFPDTGSGVSLMSHDLTVLHNLRILPHRDTTYFVAVNGSKLNVSGRVLINIRVPSSSIERLVNVVVSPDLQNEFIIGYMDLRNLEIISESFPVAGIEPSLSTKFNTLKEKLCQEFMSVLDGKLPSRPMISWKFTSTTALAFVQHMFSQPVRFRYISRRMLTS